MPTPTVKSCFASGPTRLDRLLSRCYMTGNSAGFDFGLKTFLTTSDGQEYVKGYFYQSKKRQ